MKTLTSYPGQRPVTAAVVACAVLMLAWMGRSLVTGQIPFTGDLLHFHYPLRDFYARALADGDRFDWMPSLFNGFYVVGEGQLGAYHPLHWFLYRFLRLDRAFAVELVSAYPFLFAGTWLWLRRPCGTAPAAFGALAFTFCGFALVHGVHPNLVGVVAHVPWVLLALDRAARVARGRDAWPAAAAVGLLTGSQLLLGHPQAVWFAGLIEVVYAAHLMAASSSAARRAVATTLVCGLALGVAVGAVQLLATLDALRHSTRPAYDATFATAFSLRPLHILQLVHPFLFWGRVSRWNEAPSAGDEYGVYGGAVVLLLATWWLAQSLASTDGDQPPDASQRRLGWRVAAFGAVGLWLSTGAVGGLYLVQTWLPIINQFRAPVRYTLFAQWALAVLASLALARLLRRHGERTHQHRATLWAPWALVAVAVASAAWLRRAAGPAPSSFDAIVSVWYGPMVLALAAGLLTCAVRGAAVGRAALVGLALLTGGDLALYGVRGVVAWQDFLTRQQAVGFLDSNGFLPRGGGVRLLRGGFPDLYLLAGHRLADGYLGITPTRLLDYRRADALRLAQVEYVHDDFLQGAPIADAERLDRGWLRLRNPLPRARLVTDARVSTAPATDLASVDVERSALVTRDMGLGGGPAGTAQIVTDRPGEISVTTRGQSPRQLLIVSESFDEGWSAAIDGVPVRVERVNGDFLGCVVPAGEHVATFMFRPRHLGIGKGISLGGVLAAVVVALFGRRSRR